MILRQFRHGKIIRRWFQMTQKITYRLMEGELIKVEVKDKRVLSESLGLELVDTGETLRLFNPATNEFLMTTEEMAQKLAELEK